MERCKEGHFITCITISNTNQLSRYLQMLAGIMKATILPLAWVS